ncbi:MAG: signal peptidase I [Sideroxydans sp.]|nr:signal peptidase I [Sideroxydans sp.]
MDFALIMFLLLLVTGGVWLFDRFMLRSRRAGDAKEPWWVEYSKSFFPVILAVFLLRSFLVEPFKIPSGSMIPTLMVGDFILVNKYTYGIRLPVIDKKIIEVSSPQRGDVMVFRYPENPSVDFIKRVVGLPGDVVEYRNKQLYINGVAQQQHNDGEYNYVESGLHFVHTERYSENLHGHVHPILINPDTPSMRLDAVAEFPHKDSCSYTEDEVKCTVPPGNYMMFGDNRDNSRDSRYWGFVPDSMIVGKAFAVWMNFSDLKRIGTSIN